MSFYQGYNDPAAALSAVKSLLKSRGYNEGKIRSFFGLTIEKFFKLKNQLKAHSFAYITGYNQYHDLLYFIVRRSDVEDDFLFITCEFRNQDDGDRMFEYQIRCDFCKGYYRRSYADWPEMKIFNVDDLKSDLNEALDRNPLSWARDYTKSS